MKCLPPPNRPRIPRQQTRELSPNQTRLLDAEPKFMILRLLFYTVASTILEQFYKSPGLHHVKKLILYSDRVSAFEPYFTQEHAKGNDRMPKFKEARPRLIQNNTIRTSFCFIVRLANNGEGDPDIQDGWFVRVTQKLTGNFWAGQAQVSNIDRRYRKVLVELTYMGTDKTFKVDVIDAPADPEDVTIDVGPNDPPQTDSWDTDVVIDFP